jgi:uncharacterized Tic20 family protein
MLCHLSALAGLLIPLGTIIGPLVVWLVKKNELPSVDAHGKESLNFQISMAIYFIVSAILMVIVIGFLLMIAVAVADIVFVIIASVKASNGQPYRYPLTIRFLN